jgi:hypothetical protein
METEAGEGEMAQTRDEEKVTETVATSTRTATTRADGGNTVQKSPCLVVLGNANMTSSRLDSYHSSVEYPHSVLIQKVLVTNISLNMQIII